MTRPESATPCLLMAMLLLGACGELEIAKLPRGSGGAYPLASLSHPAKGGAASGGSPSSSQTSFAVMGGALAGGKGGKGSTSDLSSSSEPGHVSSEGLGGTAAGGSGGRSSSFVDPNINSITAGAGGQLSEVFTSAAGAGGQVSEVVSPSGGAGGQSTFVITNVGGANGSNATSTCPYGELPKVLRDNSPAPADACARVSVVTRWNSSDNFLWGFTNGELYGGSDGSYASLHTWLDAPAVYKSLPAALITAIASPRRNFEGAMEVGYLDPIGTMKNLWYMAAAGRNWYASSVERSGTIWSMWYCPAHMGTDHRMVQVPDYCLDSVDRGVTYPNGSACGPLSHLGLGDYPSYLSLSTVTEVATAAGHRLYIGTTQGQILWSSEYTGDLAFDEATQQLNKALAWREITDSRMPRRAVLNITAHPNDPNQLFATFASQNADGVWLSKDGGQTWDNRHTAGLPVSANVGAEFVMIRASFHPTVTGAAYLVAPDGAYYTLNDGASWSR